MRTATYQASLAVLKKHLKLSDEDSIALIQEAVKIAHQAIRIEGREKQVLIAGSVGPYGASLHDGSEYTGSYCSKVNPDDLKDWHRPRIKALVEGGVDLLAVETIPCSVEAFAILDLLKEFPSTKAWLSFSVKNKEQISSGESFAEVVLKCWDIRPDKLLAIGANCFSPSWVIPLFSDVKKLNPSIPLIAYPNSGETFNTSQGRWITTDNIKKITEYIDEWLDFGITYIGGCCRTSNEDLLKISSTVREFRNKMKFQNETAF